MFGNPERNEMENKEQEMTERLEAATTLLERALSWLEERQSALTGEVEKISATVEQSRREAELAEKLAAAEREIAELKAAGAQNALNPLRKTMRAYFAPVNRSTQTPVLFDASEQGAFNLDTPPSPWLDLGWIHGFARKATSKSSAVLAGIPAAAVEQVRATIEAQVSLEFLSWTKLTMALATG
jgi:hypothetical protein